MSERVILHGQRDVAAQMFQSTEFAVFIERIASPAAEGNDARQTSSSFEWREALEEFGGNVAVGTEKHRIGGGVENDRPSCGRERMNMFGKERNEGRVGHQGESLGRGGSQHRRLVIEEQEHA